MSNTPTSMMSYAFQGFGLGEFFRAQQRLTDLLDAHFFGAFDVPSIYLSLRYTIEDFCEQVDRLFDENSNPNSAILRSDNKLNVQQMLRVASHGVLEAVKQLEDLLLIPGPSRETKGARCQQLFAALQLPESEHLIASLKDKIAFQAWKLRFFFRTIRMSKIKQYLPILDCAQSSLNSLLEQELQVKPPTNSDQAGRIPSPTCFQCGGCAGGAFCHPHHFDIVRRFQESCHFEGLNFSWDLKAETTLLVILHWLYTTKLGISRTKGLRQVSVRSYVNMIKTAWLLRVSCSHTEARGFSEESKTLLAILSSEVIYMFRKLQEQGSRCPGTMSLMNDGDFTIFVEGDIVSGGYRSIPTGLVSRKPLSRSQHCPTSETYDTGLELQHFSMTDESQNSRIIRTESINSKSIINTPHRYYSGSPKLPSDEQDQHGNAIISLSSPSARFWDALGSPTGHYGGVPAMHPVSMFGNQPVPSSATTSLHPTSQAQITDPRTQSIKISTPITPRSQLNERSQLLPNSNSSAGNLASLKSEYSWNQKVNQQELDVRPEETEIMPKDLPTINLHVSFTGDHYGRWDICNIRLFKNLARSTIRMLAMKNEHYASFEERTLIINETELVPEYGYHEHEPVICIRKTSPKDKENIIFLRFQSAADMFNLQLAFLGESVEANFHAVQTMRIKRHNVESYQNASVQFWHQQDIDSIGLRDGMPPTASTVRSNATVKVHSTRIVMYMYREKNLLLLFVTDSIELEIRDSVRTIRIRSSSHNPFKNSNPIKALTLGNRHVSGGIPLNKMSLSEEDQDGFGDFKWFEFEFRTLEELNSFQREFKRALNLRRRERKHADELMRLAAQGVKR